jgi:hypothetical protein
VFSFAARALGLSIGLKEVVITGVLVKFMALQRILRLRREHSYAVFISASAYRALLAANQIPMRPSLG